MWQSPGNSRWEVKRREATGMVMKAKRWVIKGEGTCAYTNRSNLVLPSEPRHSRECELLYIVCTYWYIMINLFSMTSDRIFELNVSIEDIRALAWDNGHITANEYDIGILSRILFDNTWNGRSDWDPWQRQSCSPSFNDINQIILRNSVLSSHCAKSGH